jgi:predicted nucleic acid-binding protein
VIVIADSGPLMALGKVGLIELLPRLYGQVRLPSAVHDEVVVQGLKRGYPDALLVQMAIQQGRLVVVEMNDSELPPDVAALPLAKGKGLSAKG